jgi:tartrate dehydratase beta subunit/fumarate hydratase class I family protein
MMKAQGDSQYRTPNMNSIVGDLSQGHGPEILQVSVALRQLNKNELIFYSTFESQQPDWDCISQGRTSSNLTDVYSYDAQVQFHIRHM